MRTLVSRTLVTGLLLLTLPHFLHGEEKGLSPEVAAELLKKAEVATEKITDADGAASAYWSIGALFVEAGMNKPAVNVLAKARAGALKVKDRMRRWELVEIIAREEARAGAAVDIDNYMSKGENEAQQSAVVSSIACGLWEKRDKERAQALFYKAWKLAQKISGPYKEVFYLSLADDAARAGDSETAKEFYVRFKEYVAMLGGEAERVGLRKLGEAQLDVGQKAEALKTLQAAANGALQSDTPEEAGEIAGLLAGAGFAEEAAVVVDQFLEMLEKSGKPEAHKASLRGLFADTLNREGAFPGRVLDMLSHVSVDDRAYLLPEALMNLAIAGQPGAAGSRVAEVSGAEDRVSVMCAIADGWFKNGDAKQAEAWVERALVIAKSIEDPDIKREVMLEVAEQQVAVGKTELARATWKEVAAGGEVFRRAIMEREFFQMVESHNWDGAFKGLEAMQDSPDLAILRSGLATELAKEGELKQGTGRSEKASRGFTDTAGNCAARLRKTRIHDRNRSSAGTLKGGSPIRKSSSA